MQSRVSTEAILAAYQRAGSINAAAATLGIDRSVVSRRLAKVRAGHQPASDVDAMKQAADAARLERTGIGQTIHNADDEPELTGEQLWMQAEPANARRIARASKIHTFSRNLTDGNKPVAVCAFADLHIEPNGMCDLRALREDAELVRSTPGMFATFGGDATDNQIKHRAAVLNARSKPDDQMRMFEYWLDIVASKLIVGVSGNHDDWTVAIAGVDVLARAIKARQLCFAPDEARVSLTVGGQVYSLAIRHQYRFNSSLNVVHTVKRWYDMGNEPFDVGIICHHHESGSETFWRHGQSRVGIRPGSYQFTSGYARQIGFNPASPARCPAVILFPGERRMLPFGDVREAAEVLTALRGKA